MNFLKVIGLNIIAIPILIIILGVITALYNFDDMNNWVQSLIFASSYCLSLVIALNLTKEWLDE